MAFLRLYWRVLALLRGDKWVAFGLTASAIALAGLQFLEPMLFGRVIDLLSKASSMDVTDVWAAAYVLLAIWATVGLSAIAANVAVSGDGGIVAFTARAPDQDDGARRDLFVWTNPAI